VITANEPTMKGGTLNPYSLMKSARTMEICAQNRLPIINLTESGGADLPFQAQTFVPGGKGFREITRRSAERIPTVCLVFGNSTAGGAYVPGMSDYVVMVKGGAKVFLGGPPLVKMAIHEDSTEEELGGAEMHSRVSGVSDYLAQDEPDAIRIGREIVAQLNWRKLGWSKRVPVEAPRYDPEELLGVTSIDIRKPFDVKEVIARLVDGSRFHEFKPTYGPTWSPATRTCTATRSASSPTTAFSSPNRRRRAPSSSSSAIRPTRRSSSCRTSPASWSAAATKRAASSRTAPS
jgi:acetyl-CoA carboxylase carboxyltransferase component